MTGLSTEKLVEIGILYCSNIMRQSSPVPEMVPVSLLIVYSDFIRSLHELLLYCRPVDLLELSHFVVVRCCLPHAAQFV